MNKATADGKVKRITRVTFPTASFSLSVPQIEWIARRADALGISRSEVVRRLVSREMEREKAA